MKTETKKQEIARQLNWDKLQLSSAVGHLKFLIKRYGHARASYLIDLFCIEEFIRYGMQATADIEKVKGNYLENLPFEKTKIGKRAIKKEKDQS